MNQILITEKLYITPELRRKKKLYRLEFFISVFLVCLLFSYYIYAEYDRSISEEVSQELLNGFRYQEEIENTDETTRDAEDNIIIVSLDGDELQDVQEQEPQADNLVTYTTSSGQEYTVEAELNIPRLGINYMIISETSEELLKISLNKYWGPKPNEIGNYCIVGHNYKNKKMFGKLNEIQNGDIVQLTDMNKKIVTYNVYDRYVVEPTDTRCTTQLTEGKREVTLITCTNYGQQRLVVKAREI